MPSRVHSPRSWQLWFFATQLSTDAEALRDDVLATQEQAETLRREADKSNAAKMEAAAALHALQARCDGEADARAMAESEVTRLTELIEQHRQDLEAAVAARAAEAEARAAAESDLAKAGTETTRVADTLRAEVEAANAATVEANAVADVLRADLEAAREATAAADATIAETEEKHRKLSSKAKQMIKEMKELQTRAKAAEDALAAKGSSESELEAQLTSLRERCDAMRQV